MVFALASLLLLQTQAPLPKTEPLLKSLGGFHRKVSTNSPIAQRYFDQGLVCLYVYHYRQARRSFQQAIEADPQCAMNYWGLAASYGPDINFPSVDAESSQTALAAIEKGIHAKNATPLERKLVLAEGMRFDPTGPIDRTARNHVYADAMKALYGIEPNDPDVASLYAEALIDERPWKQWTLEGKPNPGTLDAIQALERTLKLNPIHPMGLHMYIHALEASPHPEKALFAADRLFNLLPELGHAQHMPCHIYARTGCWPQAVKANLAAIAQVDAYMRSRGVNPADSPRVDHYGEALAFAASMRGQSALALGAVSLDGIPNERLGKDFADLDGDLAAPLEIEQLFGKWDKILSTPAFGERLPVSETLRQGARAVAFSATGDLKSAHEAYGQFKIWFEKIPADKWDGVNYYRKVVEVESHLALGEILIREQGHEPEGLAELKKAVECEDRLNYSEPPEWLMPTRHALGAAQLLFGKFSEALETFHENLRRNPNDGWATLGLAKAYRGLGRKKLAAATQAKFEMLWKDADVKIRTSCMCLDAEAK